MKLKYTFFTLLIMSFIPFTGFAMPELALATGNRCSTCHINMQGGGQRTDFGWKFAKDFEFFRPEDIGLRGFFDLFDPDSFGYFNKKLAFGLDFRAQTTRSHKTPDAVRRFFPMQSSVYALWQALDILQVQGQYNMGPKMFPGQQNWSASAIFKPGENMPALRLGFFQPSIGMRTCDMTSLDRRVAGLLGTESLIPPDYAEYGAEITYEGLQWMTLNAGIFDSQSLSDLSINGEKINVVESIQDTIISMNGDLLNDIAHPFWSVRAIYWSELDDEPFQNSYLGASALVNKQFVYDNIFFGTAITSDIHLFAQLAHSSIYSRRFKYTQTTDSIQVNRTTINYMAGIEYMPFLGVILGIKGEHGTSSLDVGAGNKVDIVNNQVVLYANIFLLQYIQILPEYRYLKSMEFASTRWTLQFHIYY